MEHKVFFSFDILTGDLESRITKLVQRIMKEHKGNDYKENENGSFAWAAVWPEETTIKTSTTSDTKSTTSSIDNAYEYKYYDGDRGTNKMVTTYKVFANFPIVLKYVKLYVIMLISYVSKSENIMLLQWLANT